jgi:competence protein ComEC
LDEFLATQRDRFVLFLPVFLGGGILAYFAQGTEPDLRAAAAVAGASLLAVAATWRWAAARAAALAAACAACGFALACLAASRAPPWPALPRTAAVITGKVSLLEALPAGNRVTLAAPSLDGQPPLPRSLRIRLRGTDTTPITAGETIRVRALVRPPPPPDYPGGWDTQRDAFFAGIGGYGFAVGTAEIVQARGGGFWASLRGRIAARILAALPGSRGAVAATILTGIGTAIPPGDRAAFQDSGLAHLLAVAGLHIGIVMGLVYGGVRMGLAAWERAALRWPTRQIAALAALAAGLLYLMLTGAHVPILRSFAMAGLVTLGVITGRRALSLRGLALAAMLLLVAAPESVVAVSFQMSFAAVLVLIAGFEMARPALARIGGAGWRHWIARHTAALALTSLLAGAATLPFAAAHFGRIALYTVAANMLAVPLMAAWVMPWGLAALLVMPLGIERAALIPMGWGVQGLLAIAHGVAGWPGAVLAVPQTPAWGLACSATGLVWACLWRGRLRLAGLLPLAAGLASPYVVTLPDILVGPEARVIAMRIGGQILLQAAPASSAFETESPALIWGNGTALPFTTLPPYLACTDMACRAAFAGGLALLVRDTGAPDCAARVIISAGWLHNPCPGAVIVDHAMAAREGAVAIRVNGAGVDITTDRMLRKTRPWVITANEGLPMAKTE